MSIDKYKISFYSDVISINRIKRKWFELWKPREVVLEGQESKRYSISITLDEWKTLSGDKLRTGPMWRILFKALANVSIDNINDLRIEEIDNRYEETEFYKGLAQSQIGIGSI